MVLTGPQTRNRRDGEEQMTKAPLATFFVMSCLAFTTLASALGVPATEDNVALSRLTLSTDRRFFVSAQGYTSVLRGVNLVSKTEPYTYQAMGIDEEDVKLIRQMGLNVVRLGINWAAIEPKAGSYDSKYIEKYFETVKLFVQNGIYVLVDLHQDAYAAKHGGFGLQTGPL